MSALERVQKVIDRISYSRIAGLEVNHGTVSIAGEGHGDTRSAEERRHLWIEVAVPRRDARDGVVRMGYGGKRYLPEDASEGDIVRAVFGAISAYEEHERREFFTVDGRAVFGPHIMLNAMLWASTDTDWKERS